MSIESDIFIKKRPRFELFAQFGFVENTGRYIYECDFMDGDFHAKIEIDTSGKISGKVIDTMTDEEYLPLRVPARNSAFVNTVRHEYEKILINIANNCYATVLFTSHQANRITEKIYTKYTTRPDFPWDCSAYKPYGIFRHEENKKWYAAIFNIKMSLLDTTSLSASLVDIINVKIDSADGEQLRKENGMYFGYHMHHKYWISLILDDTLTDERILELVDRSYVLTKGTEKQRRSASCRP